MICKFNFFFACRRSLSLLHPEIYINQFCFTNLNPLGSSFSGNCVNKICYLYIAVPVLSWLNCIYRFTYYYYCYYLYYYYCHQMLCRSHALLIKADVCKNHLAENLTNYWSKDYYHLSI